MIAYLNSKADKRIINSLIERGFEVELLPPFNALSEPVSSHADMLLLAVGDTLFIHKDYNLEIKGFDKIIKIDEPISAKYPNDILLNIAIVGKNVFANTNHASKTVLNHLKGNGYSIHCVSQGYTHCSICTVNENAIITADKGIAMTAQSVGVDVLLISEGNISLPPYNHGFIGGACGACDDTLYFCGSLSCHPDGEIIKNFIQSHKKSVIELGSLPLCDIGGVLFK